MEIILKEDVTNLGYKDDVVKVRDGYARNFLIPKGMAMTATPSAKKELAETLRQKSLKLAKVREEATKIAGILNSITLKVEMLAGKDGKIFGSVTSTMLGNLLREKGFDLDRRKIQLNQEVSTLGSYAATIDLHKEVKAEVKFDVVAKIEE